MSYQIPSQVTEETPIERIFERVMRRKMTPEEKQYFRLKTSRIRNGAKSNNGAGPPHKNGTK